MKLVYDDRTVATITDYGYEAPWASGRGHFTDPDFHQQMIAASQFLDWLESQDMDLSDDAYMRELHARGLSDDVLDRYEQGDWTVLTDEGEEKSIYRPRFGEDSQIEWRW